MHPLEKKITKLLKREKLILPGEIVVVGVSGGPDSLALLHILGALGHKLVAVYVNHGLRPARETGREEELVREQAAFLKIPWESGRVEVREVAADKKMSIEQAARELRYDFFEKTAEKFQAGKIAVAHTADDQAEEVLLRLIRGTGRCGLAGMNFIRADRIIRPLLTTAKQSLTAYLADKKIAFLEDSSNKERRFLRNRIRLDLLPELEKYNPNISRTLRRTALILTDEENLLAELTVKAWRKIIREADNNIDFIQLDIKHFIEIHRAVQRRILEMIFVKMRAQPSFAKIEQLILLAEQGQGGAMLHFGQGLRVIKKNGFLFFSYPCGRSAQRGNLLDKQK